MDTFETMLECAGLGLSLSRAEIDRLRPYYKDYAGAFKPLYEADLQDEEVAGRFIASPGVQPWTQK